MYLRSVFRRPAWSVIGTFAISVAILTATFSVVYAAIFRSPPFPRADRVVMLYSTHRASDGTPYKSRWSFPRLEIVRHNSRSFASVAPYSRAELNLTGGDETEQIQSEFVAPEYFDVLGVAAARGRRFAADENDPNRRVPVVVIGHQLWQRRFGSRTDVVGQTIGINSVTCTIVGVMPPRFRGLSDRAQLWLPTVMAPALTYPQYLTTDQDFISLVARLAPNATYASATAELQRVAARAYAEVPSTDSDSADTPAGEARPLNEARALNSVRTPLFALFGAVVLLHLLALANATSLLLGRAIARGREYAVRTALGALPRTLRAHAFSDAALHVAIGGLIGTMLGLAISMLAPAPLEQWGARNFYGALAPFADTRFDWAVIAFGVGLTTITALVAGFAPATAAARTDWIASLRDAPRGSSALGLSLRRPSARAFLVASEMAFAMALCVAGGLMFDSFMRMRSTPIGVDADGVLTFSIRPPDTRVPTTSAAAYIGRMLVAITSVPGVRSATVDGGAPVSGTASSTLMIVGRQNPPAGRAPAILRHYVAPAHFTTLGIPMVQGRPFNERDVAGSPTVTIISETAARRFWPNADPIGQRVWFGGGSAFSHPDSSAEIVGVVRDVMYEPLDGAPNKSSFYTPYAQFSYGWRIYFVRSERGIPPLSLVAPIRLAVHGVDAEVPVSEVRDLPALIGSSWSRQRADAALYGAFAFLALGIAVAGIYAVVAHSVAQRTREMGIRLALGAKPNGIVTLILREGLVFPTLGVVAGFFLALGTGRFLRSSLHGVAPSDPTVIAATMTLLWCAAVAACAIPALRATRLNPSDTLRAE